LLHRAENPAKKQIAVKITTLAPLPTQYRFRLQSGFNILRYLKEHAHANIVPIEEIYESPEKSYVFMDVFETDLFQRIKREAPFKEKEGLRIAKDVAHGLQYLHSIGVAHENLKSHHVLFHAGHDGRAVLTGFGWSVVAFDIEKDEAIKQMGSSKQKFHHDFAPEKMKDDLYDPIIADVWSFAALTVSILTKDHPYEMKSAHRPDIQWKLTFKKNGVKLSDKVYEILEKCFSLDPESRATMIDVVDQFDK
jgi:serine/threonine protein kinase